MSHRILNSFVLVVAILTRTTTTTTTTATPIIATNLGLLQGETVNNAYHAYRAIPYAQAPLAERRFEPPLPLAAPWPGVLNCTRTAPQCLQWSGLDGVARAVGSEDCLYLNVFVPITEAAQPLPVMVFIHGGGLMWGSADFYGEQYIMQHGGLLLVTLNYRLGPFGFLSTEDDEISGNMGLKDQSLALKFVYENIAAFGGDREQILLTGWSAGGASVHFHMVSERTEAAWFRAAVSFSGTALCPCHAVYAGEAHKKAQQLAAYLNCTTSERASSGGVKACLRRKSAPEIIATVPRFYQFGNHPFAVFGPVIERGTEAFLSDHVERLMRAGKTKPKPWLLTRTAEDGAVGTAEFLKRDQNGRELIFTLDANWNEWAPVMLFLNASWTPAERIAHVEDLRRAYFGDRAIGLQTYDALERLYNEELSRRHVENAAGIYVNCTVGAHAYGYVYANPAPYGLGNVLAERDDWQFGTLHGDDVFLVFKTPVRQRHPLRQDEVTISKALIEMLAQMAQTGDPSYKGAALPTLDAANRFEFTQITS